MMAEFDENKDKVVNMLIENVMKVDCEIPRVVKGDYE